MTGPNIFETLVGGALSHEMPALLEALRGIHQELKRYNDTAATKRGRHYQAETTNEYDERIKAESIDKAPTGEG